MYSNVFQSLGNIWYPLNFSLIPEYFITSFFFANTLQSDPRYLVAIYAIASTELFIGTLVIGRFLGLAWGAALITAWALPLMAEPYFGYSLLYPIFMLTPWLSAEDTELLLIVVVFGLIGRGRESLQGHFFKEASLTLLLLALVAHLTAWAPTWVMIWAPVAFALCLSLLLTAGQHERKIKIAAMAAVLIVLVASGLPMFVLGMFKYSVAAFWGTDLLERPPGFTDPGSISIWYGNGATGPFGPYLMAFGTLGMVMAAIFGDRRLKGIAFGCLALVVAIFVVGWSTLRWDFWRGPMPLYFEFGLWPFYAVFAAWGITTMPIRLFLRYCPGRFTFAANSIAMHTAMALMLGLGLFYAWPVNNRVRLYAVPHSKPPMVATLQELIGLSLNQPFRGRVTTMESLDKPDPIDWMDWVRNIQSRYEVTGNEYHYNGFWFHEIPTLFEYSPVMSPAFFKAMVRLLGRPGDKQLRNVVVLRRPDARILGLFGVRYVVTDGRLQTPFRLVMTEKTHKDEVLSLYEVPEVNVGNWSPTEVFTVHSFDDVLDKIANGSFDGKKSALIFDAEASLLDNSRLVPAREAVIRMLRGKFSVEAKSDGESLLVLPFEFSHCLSIVKSRSGTPRLIRVNAIETGIIFNGDLQAEVQYYTGPFYSSGCRLADANELSKLHK